MSESSYSNTIPSEISSGLDELFGTAIGAEAHSANANFIIPVSTSGYIEQIESMLEIFTAVHSSRFFIIHITEEVDDLETEIAVMCNVVRKTYSSCSAVVKVKLPLKKFSVVPNIIHSNCLTGLPTELFIIDPGLKFSVVSSLSDLVDIVLFDSSVLPVESTSVSLFLNSFETLIDFRWIAIGNWRDQIRNVFEKQTITEKLFRLESVTIASINKDKSNISIAAYLLAGFIIDRLNLNTIAFGKSGFECVTTHGDMISLNMPLTERIFDGKIDYVCFEFKSSPEQKEYIKISRGEDGLITEVCVAEGGYNIKSLLPLKDIEDLIYHYYTVGESFQNYRPALTEALELKRLKSGFFG